MTRRATLRGAQRTPVHGDAARADVLICGASFAGLAAARELTGSGADVLVVDRYEIGERQTSACAVPTPWVRALGLEAAVRQELDCMAFHTPHGSHRFRLPWSWSAFDYRELCEALWAQCPGVRFQVAHVTSRGAAPEAVGSGGPDPAARAAGVAEHETSIREAADIVVHTDRGDLFAPLVVDALGWRRVLGAGPVVQPPEATISRGLEVHPRMAFPPTPDLDVWIDRSLVRYGYAWNVPAGSEQRVGAGSYEPRHHVREPTVETARRLGLPPERFQGNWFPHRLRPAVEDGVCFAGDAAGHCLPLSGEGIRTALHFGGAAGRELRAVVAGDLTRDQALERYGAFSAGHKPVFELAYGLQWLVPRLPPRLLTALLGVLGRPRLCRPAFAWYLRQAGPPVPAAAPAATTRRVAAAA